MAVPANVRSYDVAIIGAGVFGAWTAYQLQRSGKRILLVDAFGPANSRASSGDESRIMRLGYGADAIYTISAARSLARWRDLEAAEGEQLFHKTGVLWLCDPNDPYPIKTAETLQQLSIPFRKLSAGELAEQYPQFGLEGIAWGLLEPDSGVLAARRAVQTVVRAIRKCGGDYLHDRVLPPAGEQKLDSVTAANAGRISAAHFVFACGPWLPKLFPQLLAGRINPTRQEVFYFAPPTGSSQFRPPALPVWINFADEAYGLPDIEGRGVKTAIDRHGPPFDPDRDDRQITSAGLEEMRECLGRRLPALRAAALNESRVCQYENTSNGDFLIDRHPALENVWLVGGGSGHGFKHGPAVAEYLCARIDGSSEMIEPRFSLSSKLREQHRTVY